MLVLAAVAFGAFLLGGGATHGYWYWYWNKKTGKKEKRWIEGSDGKK